MPARILAAWPDGEWTGEAFLDDDGFDRTDIAIRARVTKQGDSLRVDLTESDPQTTGFVNSSFANMHSAVAMAFAYLIDPEIPKNDGAFRPLEVMAKQGTVVWADEDAAGDHVHQPLLQRDRRGDHPRHAALLPGARHGRLGPALPRRDPGRGCAPAGPAFIWHMFHARPGGGGSSGGDGWSTSGEWHTAGGLKFGSVEMAEARFPLHFEHHEFRPARPATASTAAASAASWCCGSRATGRPAPTPPATARGTARPACCGGEDGEPHHYVLRHGRRHATGC